jgi:hypothetical protein
MKRITMLLIIVSGLKLGCSLVGIRTYSATASWRARQSNLVEDIKKQKAIIDTLIENRNHESIMYLKVKDKIEAIRVTDESYGKDYDVEKIYVLQKGDSNKVVAVEEFPKYGDNKGAIALTYYFDKDGRTFGFQQIGTYIGLKCRKLIIHEIDIQYFNKSMQSIYKFYEMADQNGKLTSREICDIPKYKFNVVENLKQFLQNNKISLSSGN